MSDSLRPLRISTRRTSTCLTSTSLSCLRRRRSRVQRRCRPRRLPARVNGTDHQQPWSAGRARRDALPACASFAYVGTVPAAVIDRAGRRADAQAAVCRQQSESAERASHRDRADAPETPPSVPHRWQVVWISGAMHAGEEFFHVFVESTFTNLIGEGLDQCVVPTVTAHAKLTVFLNIASAMEYRHGRARKQSYL